MGIVIAAVTDLIFSTKITGTAKALGGKVLVARSVEKLEEHLLTGEQADPPLVIVDLNANGLDVMDAIRTAKKGGAKVVAYLSHVQLALAEEARAAGADEVMPRSVFVERLPGMLGA